MRCVFITHTHKRKALLPFHPPSQQLQVDLAHQVGREIQGVLALHWVLSLQLVPVKDVRCIKVNV